MVFARSRDSPIEAGAAPSPGQVRFDEGRNQEVQFRPDEAAAGVKEAAGLRARPGARRRGRHPGGQPAKGKGKGREKKKGRKRRAFQD